MSREIVKVEHEFMGNSFVQAVLRIGGMGLAFHCEELAMKYDGAPLIIAECTWIRRQYTVISVFSTWTFHVTRQCCTSYGSLHF